VKRTYLTRREIEIAMKFKEGYSIDRLGLLYCRNCKFVNLRQDDCPTIQGVIRKAMRLPRWWIPKPKVRRSK
jgi:hypothetical protein